MNAESTTNPVPVEKKPSKFGSYVKPVGLNGDSTPHTIFTFMDTNTGEFLGGAIEFGQVITINYPDGHLVEYTYGNAKQITGSFTDVDGGLCFDDASFTYADGTI